MSTDLLALLCSVADGFVADVFGFFDESTGLLALPCAEYWPTAASTTVRLFALGIKNMDLQHASSELR